MIFSYFIDWSGIFKLLRGMNFALSTLLKDSRILFQRSDMIFNLALEDLRDRYRRSYLGIAWVTLSFLLFIGIKLLIFSRLNTNIDVNFGISLIAGFGTWMFISSVVTEGANTFNVNKTWILSTSLPYMTYIFQNTIRNLLSLLLIIMAMFPLLFLCGMKASIELLTIIPAIAVLIFASVWTAMFLAPLCTYSKDLDHLLALFMRIMFFATPIIWTPGSDPVLNLIAIINPFYHFIELIRAPILGQGIAMQSWLIVILITFVGIIAGAISYIGSQRHIPFWV